MLEIHTDEKEVLGKFIHPELFGLVLEEINLTKPVTIDIVRQLFHHGFLKALDEHGKPMLSIEVDRILKTRFQLTNKGFEALNEQ